MEETTKITIEKKALKDAFEICFLVADQLGNIIASVDFQRDDKLYYNQAKRFIRAYKKALKTK